MKLVYTTNNKRPSLAHHLTIKFDEVSQALTVKETTSGADAEDDLIENLGVFFSYEDNCYIALIDADSGAVNGSGKTLLHVNTLNKI